MLNLMAQQHAGQAVQGVRKTKRRRVAALSMRVASRADAKELHAEIVARASGMPDLSTMTRFTSSMSAREVMEKIMGRQVSDEELALA